MKIAEVKVAKTTCETTLLVPIPKGIVGATVSIEYTDSAWDGLQKTVVFRSAVTKDVLASGNEVVIPAEVVSRAGRNLYIGVYGVDAANNVVIPTIWAELGPVNSAAAPSGDVSSDPSLPVWAQIQAMIGNLEDLDTTAKNNLVSAVNEAMTKGGGTVDAAEIQRIVEDYLASNSPTVTESDPTVPAWAKEPAKPSYTAAEVGALPDTYTPPNQTAQQVGADPAGTAASAVSKHNVDAAAHNDLRLTLQELANRINAALDSDDTTLDQMSEVVAYIKSNKSLIDAITTSKVSVSDIVNDLVTNVTDKPLSAAQGVALKKLIDDLQAMIPEAYSLPVAAETVLGGVKPVTATEDMTQPVGVDAEGRLMTKPGSGGSGIAVSGATVGQTVKISAVDENGVPTAWEPVDLPSGGGGGEWRLINTFTIETEDLAKVYFNTDLGGNPFELRELWIVGDGRNATTHSGSTSMVIYTRLGNGTTGDKAQYEYPIKVNSTGSNYQRGFVTWFELLTETKYRALSSSLVNMVTCTNPTLTAGFAVKEIDAIREIAIFPGSGSVLYGVGTVISIYGR